MVDDQIRRAINLHYRKFPAKILSDNNGLQQEIPNPALYEYPLEGEAGRNGVSSGSRCSSA